MKRQLLAVLGSLLVSGGPTLAQGQAIAERYRREVQRLAAHPTVVEALRHVRILADRTRRDHIALTEIPAPPFGEERRGIRYAQLLEAAGADSVWIDAEGNVLARRRGVGDGGTVVLSAHLDTVFPEGTDVGVTVRGDTLFAPGVGDDVRGLVVVLTVLRALEAAGLETGDDVLFVGTVGEEGIGDLRGVKHLFRDGGPPIDAFISVDGSGLVEIVNAGLGSHRYRVTFTGPGGHSWGAFGLANPHHALGRGVYHFVEAADPFTREWPRTSYNVGRIGGGTSVNSIPFESWMEIDMRSVRPERLEAIDRLMRHAMRRALAEQNALVREGPSLELELRMIGDRPSGEVAPEEPLVQRALAATRHVDAEPALERSSTDSNIPIALGIPAVTIGGGGEGRGAHSPGEWWLDRNSAAGIERALLLVVAQAGVTR